MKYPYIKLTIILPVVIAVLNPRQSHAHNATYNTHYTNSSTQVSLNISPTEVTYWDGTTLSMVTMAGAYPFGRTSAGPTISIGVRYTVDGNEVATASLPWGPYTSAWQVTNTVAVLDLAEGTHTVTVEHPNRFEFNTETIYRSTYTHKVWFTTYRHYYYDVFHYFAVPCSASKTLTVKPSPNFHRLEMDIAGSEANITYTGIPTNTYWLYRSFDLETWHLHSSSKSITNGIVRFTDYTDEGPVFYKILGP